MRNLLLAVLLCITIISCDKNDLPEAPGDTLAKVEYNPGGAIKTDTFIYDAQHRVIQLASASNVYDLIYNAQGRLLTVNYNHVAGPLTQLIHSSAYTYDINGKIVKKTTTDPSMVVVEEVYYTYNAAGKLIADTQYVSGNQPLYNTYAYDNNGNVIRMEEFKLVGSTFTSNGISTLQYDDKLSPYHKIGDVLFYINESPNYLFKSNITRATFNGIHTGRNYIYEYYSNGVMHTAFYNDPQPFGGSARIRYTFVQP